MDGDNAVSTMARGPATDGEPSHHDLGVLFVHGIGDQRRGDSLVGWADSCQTHLHRLLTFDDRVERFREQREQSQDAAYWPAKTDKARVALEALEMEAAEAAASELALDRGMSPVLVSDARLRGNEAAEEPAHLTLTITRSRHPGAPLTDDNADTPTRWLFAESWWAKEFSPPPAGVMLRWALQIAPAVVLGHFATASARQSETGVRRMWRMFVMLFLYLVSLALLFVGLLCLVVLLVLGTVPVPRLSAYARGLSARLAVSVGDSFVLVASASQYDAMISRVEVDLAWLAARCERVAVVAHSQGALIAHRALSRQLDPKVHLFVTIGSGLGKLSELKALRLRPGATALAWLAIAIALTAAVAMVFAYWVFGGWSLDLLGVLSVPALYLIASMFLFVGMVKDRSREEVRRWRDLRPVAAAGRMEWVDFFASADPVPNGPILAEDPEWLRSYQVWNESSWISDHSAYRSNIDGLIAPLIGELDRASPRGGGRTANGLARRVHLLARRRSWRCVLLVRARIALAIGAVIALPYHWSGFRSWGRAIRERFSWGDKVSLPGDAEVEVDLLLAIALGVATVYAAVVVTTWSWRKIGKRDLRRFYRGDDPDFGGWPFLMFAVVVTSSLLAATLPLFVASRDLADLVSPVRAGPWQAAVTYFVGVVVAMYLVKDDGPAVRREEAERRAERRLAESLQVAAVALPLAIPLFVGFLRFPYETVSGGVGWLHLVLVVVALALTAVLPVLAARRLLPWLSCRLNVAGAWWVAKSVRRRGCRDASAEPPAAEATASVPPPVHVERIGFPVSDRSRTA